MLEQQFPFDKKLPKISFHMYLSSVEVLACVLIEFKLNMKNSGLKQ